MAHFRVVVRTKPADQRREELLDSAEASFLERGISATTIDHVTQGAGVAKGTFYLYFRSRADVVAAVQRRYGERFAHQIQEALDAAGDDWGAKLDACVDTTLRDHQAGRALHDALFHDVPPDPSDELDEAVDDFVAVFRDLLSAGVAAGAYDVDDVDITAVLLVNTLHGIFDPLWVGSKPLDEVRLMATARRIFRRTVGLPA